MKLVTDLWQLPNYWVFKVFVGNKGKKGTFYCEGAIEWINAEQISL